MRPVLIRLSLLFVVLSAIVSCSGGGGGDFGSLSAGPVGNGSSGGGSGVAGTWTWKGGSTISDQTGTYGTQGVPASGNVPGGRVEAASWLDGSGNFWLFGGDGFSSTGGLAASFLNDLWKFDGTNWTWVKGSIFTQATGTYGVKGTPAAANTPGARSGAASWSVGNDLWLFGGFGFGSSGSSGSLNDLWRFDGTSWTWMNGAFVTNQTGTYGTKGLADPANIPGARFRAATAIDGSIVWLFGGRGYDGTGIFGDLNDLWKFDGTKWTWVSGSNTSDQSGSYGAKGIPNSANMPGGRESAVLWIDGGGNLWLFGGTGRDSTSGSGGYLNDLWKFNGTTWIWVSGATIVNQLGIYGTQGVTATGNEPGSRNPAASWIDLSNNLWLFGGFGYDSVSLRDMNDLWKFDGTDWTWVAGAKVLETFGIYGAKNVAVATNYPGSRDAATRAVDGSHTVWMFGGMGKGSGTTGRLNDLWLHQP